MAKDRRVSPAPPPTPIATGKGLRSAAVDDRVLAEYLENSLRVPELRLPESFFPAARSPFGAAAVVELASLLAREEAAVRRVLNAATGGGAVWVRGGDVVAAEEVRAVMELARRVSGGAAELCWHRPARPEIEAALAEVLHESLQPFREKIENIASKLETVAECIAQILSENVKNRNHHEAIGKRESVLCLRKIGHGHQTKHDSHALSLCISTGDDHEPVGSIFILMRKPIQEWSNGEFKCSAFEEPYHEEGHDSDPLYLLEFMCSPLALDGEHCEVTKTISLMDQMSIVITLILLYNLWAWVYSKLTKI